jgi:TRAP-type mannitol/chloroaromatic compound transport system substrate-binding protein
VKRKQFLQTTIAGITTGTALTACRARGKGQQSTAKGNLPSLEWQMATSWPISLDTIFGGAKTFSDRVAALTDGRFKIVPRSAGELAPPLEVLSVVAQGAVPCGHTAGYYYIGKTPATAFGTSLPFGLNAQQQNAWLYEGGGLKLLQALYAKKFGVIQFPCGNTGVQMGGWFRKEIATANDLKGLKIRIPGLGGQVMSKLGATVQTLPGGEIFQALQTGAIDAAEWVGPYDDEKLGLQRVAEYYYYPGWWEPGPTLELQINLRAWQQLPVAYQEAIRSAAYEANANMLAKYDTLNNQALDRLVKGGVKLRAYSEDILTAAERASFELYAEFAAKDADFKQIFEVWKPFRDRMYAWHNINEGGFVRHSYRKLSR